MLSIDLVWDVRNAYAYGGLQGAAPKWLMGFCGHTTGVCSRRRWSSYCPLQRFQGFHLVQPKQGSWHSPLPHSIATYKLYRLFYITFNKSPPMFMSFCVSDCLLRVAIATIKHHDQKAGWGKEFHMFILQFIIKESQDTCQKLFHKLWSSDGHCLDFSGLIRLHS